MEPLPGASGSVALRVASRGWEPFHKERLPALAQLQDEGLEPAILSGVLRGRGACDLRYVWARMGRCGVPPRASTGTLVSVMLLIRSSTRNFGDLTQVGTLRCPAAPAALEAGTAPIPLKETT